MNKMTLISSQFYENGDFIFNIEWNPNGYFINILKKSIDEKQ